MPDFLNASVGEYRLTDFIGAGGMGEVYRAVHGTLGRVAAVKVLLRAATDSSSRERFHNEARVQASLRHPNIAVLYDFGSIEVAPRSTGASHPCIIMELVEGDSLRERIQRCGRLDVAEAVRIARALIDAVGYLHSRDIVHRDLTSSNVKLGSGGHVKLLDFGIAKSPATRGMTKATSWIGTLETVAPERLRGKPADQRSDIWSLGVLLYEMITGRNPFQAASPEQMHDRILRASFTPASQICPTLPPAMDEIIGCCLAHEPRNRYRRATDILVDLDRIASSRASSSSPVSWPALPALGTLLGRRQVSIVQAKVREWLCRGEQLAQHLAGEARRLTGEEHRALIFLLPSIALILAVVMSMTLPSWISVRRAGATVTAGTTEVSSSVPVARVVVPDGPADVFQDGRWVGTTPYELRGTPGDRYELVLRRAGYEDRREVIRVLEKPHTWTITMKRKGPERSSQGGRS